MTNFSDLTVIIPTLNEASNIPKLIGLLAKRYKGVSIIISDDGSTDGTASQTLNLAKKNKNIKLNDRSLEKIHGLTASIADKKLMRKVSTPKIIIMDGDLQHPIDKINEMYKQLDKNDIVVAVRTNKDTLSLLRKVLSGGMFLISYVVFRIRKKPTTKDMMSGYFGIRTKLFKYLVYKHNNQFVLKGYKVLLDILRLCDSEVKVSEIFYSTFTDRKNGSSKFRFRHILYTLESTFR
ncbi:MAG: glycosyltransferase [Candidatus Micrarchaeaceae archaeon]